MKRYDLTSIVGIILTLVVGIISVIAQYQTPQTNILIFLALIGAIVFYFIISYPLSIVKSKLKSINNNSRSIKRISKDLNIIKDRLEFKREVDELKIRINSLENLIKMKGKKGNIDPRWIIIVVILILFVLFLRSKGII
jgi:flagellar motor component MotA|tara:strand:- start:28241 stop:28657 length:417 start_codon:yes stop_codon:yes gene_type:complete